MKLGCFKSDSYNASCLKVAMGAVLAASLVFTLTARAESSVQLQPKTSFSNRDSRENTILITASPFAQKLSDMPNSVFIVSQEDIEMQRVVARNLSEVISNLVPGFSPSTETMSTFGQNFRGGKAIVMIDGVLISTTLRAGGRDLQSISVDAIQRIEVIKGASALYGNGEAGAIINVMTKTPTVDVEMQTTLSAEAFGSELSDTGYSLSQTFSGTTQSDVGFVVNLSGKDRGNLYDADGKRLPSAPNSQGGMGDADEYDMLVKLDKEQDDSRIAFLGHHYKIVNHLQFKRSVNEENGLVEIDPTMPYTGFNPGTKLSTLQLTYDHADVFGQQLNMSTYVSEVHVNYESGADIVSKRSGFKAAFLWAANDRNQVTYGFEYGRDNTEQGSMQPVIIGQNTDGDIIESQYVCSVCDLTETKLSPFAQYSSQLSEDFTLQLGLRYENFDIEVPDYQRYIKVKKANPKKGNLSPKTGDTLAFDKPLVNLGAVYRFNKATETFASFSQGYSHADMRMLRDIPVDTVAEFADNIPATQTNYLETGLRYNDVVLQSGVAIFYSDINDGYGYDYNVKAQNNKRVASVIVADEEIWGFEATIDYRVHEAIKLGSAISQSEGKRINDETGIKYWMNDTKITPIKISAYAEYRFDEAVVARLQVNYVGDREKNNPESDKGYSFYESPYDGYTLVDLVSTYDTGYGIITFGIDNLLNEDYQPLVSQMNKEVIWEKYRNQFSGYGRRFAIEYSVVY